MRSSYHGPRPAPANEECRSTASARPGPARPVRFLDCYTRPGAAPSGFERRVKLMFITGRACPIPGNARESTIRIPQVGVSNRVGVIESEPFSPVSGKGLVFTRNTTTQIKQGKVRPTTYKYQYEGPPLSCVWFYLGGRKNKIIINTFMLSKI